MRYVVYALILLSVFSGKLLAQCSRIDSDFADSITSAQEPDERDSEIIELPPGTKLQGLIKENPQSFVTAYPSGYFLHTGFSDGLAKITVDGKNGFIDAEGKVRIAPQFGYVGCFSEDLAAIEVNKKWGFINKSGKIAIPAEFDFAASFSEGLALVKVGELWGFINKSGGFIVKPQFGRASNFSEGLANVGFYDKDYVWTTHQRTNGKWRDGFIDKKGNWAIQPNLDGAYTDFNGGMAVVSRNIGYNNGVISESYVIDKSGRERWKLNSWHITEFSEGFIVVAVSRDEKTMRDKYSFLDKNGNRVTDKSFDALEEFSQGLSIARVGDYSGFINTKGDFVIAPKFWSASSFSEGLAAVYENGKAGFINKEGKWIIKPQFDWADDFHEGICVVAIGDKIGYINKTGKYIWKPTK